MATEIVALGHAGGVIVVGDKRSVTRGLGRENLFSDQETKVFQTAGTGVVAMSGVAKFSVDNWILSDGISINQPKQTNVLDELRNYVEQRHIETDEDRTNLLSFLVTLFSKAPPELIAEDIQRNGVRVLESGLEAPPLLFILVINFDSEKQKFEVALIEVFYVATSATTANMSYQIKCDTFDNHAPSSNFLSVLGAQSQNVLSLQGIRPPNEKDALKLVAKEILATHNERKNIYDDVGKVCDVFFLRHGSVTSIKSIDLKSIIKGKVKIPK